MAEPQDQLGVVLIEEDSLNESYTSIPNTILKRDDVSPGAKLAYVMLLSYAHQTDRCFPGQTRLARDMGVGERSLIRYLKELRDRQLLEREAAGSGPHQYLHPGQVGQAQSCQIGRSGTARTGGSGSAKLAGRRRTRRKEQGQQR